MAQLFFRTAAQSNSTGFGFFAIGMEMFQGAPTGGPKLPSKSLGFGCHFRAFSHEAPLHLAAQPQHLPHGSALAFQRRAPTRPHPTDAPAPLVGAVADWRIAMPVDWQGFKSEPYDLAAVRAYNAAWSAKHQTRLAERTEQARKRKDAALDAWAGLSPEQQAALSPYFSLSKEPTT